MNMCVYLLQSMTGLHGSESNILSACGGTVAVGVLLVLLGIVFGAPNIWQIKWRSNLPLAIALSLVFVVCVLRFDGESPFLYFQF